MTKTNPGKLLGALATAVAAVLLCRCDMQTAGSSVGTGNPTEIQVAFTGDGGTPKGLTGNVEVYAATQVPVPGFQPEPLARLAVNGEKTRTLLASDLVGIADSLWPKSSREGDSIYRFNVVVKSTAADAPEGVIIGGLGYRPGKEATFKVPAELKNPGGKDGAVLVWADLVGLVDLDIMVKGASQEYADVFVFLPGTDYVVKGDSDKFSMRQVPKGRYVADLVTLWQQGHRPTGSPDTAYVLGFDSLFDTEKSDTLTVGGIKDSLPLPSEYR